MTALYSSVLPGRTHGGNNERANRRRGRRHRLSVPATLVPETGGGAPLCVRVVELSVGGIGMSTDALVHIGAVYVVSAYDTLLPPGLRVKAVSQHTHDGVRFVGAAIL